MFVAQLLAFEMRVAAAHVRAARGRGRFFFADGLGFLVCFHGEIGFWKAPTALTKRRFPITFCALPCRDGGIGRRTRFRSWRWQHCGGSSPLLGTSLTSSPIRFADSRYLPSAKGWRSTIVSSRSGPVEI